WPDGRASEENTILGRTSGGRADKIRNCAGTWAAGAGAKGRMEIPVSQGNRTHRRSDDPAQTGKRERKKELWQVARVLFFVYTGKVWEKNRKKDMGSMEKIVIIGANDFQRPLIKKARQMGYETHVFAWREGATGARDADFFYEISITEKEKILETCRQI